MVTPESPAYWDLVLGHHRGRPFWPDPLDPDRRGAWDAWRLPIMTRWAMWYRMGHRPDAWFVFDAPALAAKRDVQLENMERREIVYALTDDPREKAMIEDGWRQGIASARQPGASRTQWRKRAAGLFDVPRWFFDLEAAE
jgi:hypothetical protein